MPNDLLVYLGLGSNRGDRQQHLQTAVDHLSATHWFQITQLSSLYDTEPVGPVEQASFLNAVVEGRTALMPGILFRKLMKLERGLGRRRTGPPGGPREIDIDLLYAGTAVFQTRELQLPHSGIWERRFVLEPLNEIAPMFICPQKRKTIGTLLKRCADTHAVTKLDQTLRVPESQV